MPTSVTPAGAVAFGVECVPLEWISGLRGIYPLCIPTSHLNNITLSLMAYRPIIGLSHSSFPYMPKHISDHARTYGTDGRACCEQGLGTRMLRKAIHILFTICKASTMIVCESPDSNCSEPVQPLIARHQMNLVPGSGVPVSASSAVDDNSISISH
jgi:hypothetical protein